MGEMVYGLENKVVVVTGGSRGIGLALAGNLLKEGAKVAICGRKPDNLAAAVKMLEGGDDLLALPCHVAQADQVEAFFQAVLERFGRVDGLINNVGMNIMTSSVADTDPSLWNKILDTNLGGAFLCSRRAAAIMRKQKAGKIVSVSSTAGRRAAMGMGVYGVAKAGVEMLTKVLAAELAGENIQVNAVAPGMVKTDFSKPFWSNPELHAAITARIPLGRLAVAMDVVHPVLFLCSAGADYITGQTLVVDGGAGVI